MTVCNRQSRPAREYLFSTQDAGGYWCGELEADTTLESDYIFLHTLLGTRNEERFQKTIREIARHQNEDGGWPIFQGGPSNISAAVKAYFAFKLCGHHADEPALVKARDLHPGARRRPGGQYLYQNLSLRARAVRL